MLKKLLSIVLIISLLCGFSTVCFAANETNMTASVYRCCYTCSYAETDLDSGKRTTLHSLEIRFDTDLVSIKETPALLYNFFYGLSASQLAFDADSDTIFIYLTGKTQSKDIERIEIPANTVFDAEGRGNQKMTLTDIQEEDISFEDHIYSYHYNKVEERYWITAGKSATIKNNKGVKFNISIDDELYESNISECSVPIYEGKHTITISIPYVGNFEVNYEAESEIKYNYADCVGYKFNEGTKTALLSLDGFTLPIAFLGIPVLGPFLSAFSVVLIPFTTLGYLFYGMLQMAASPITGLILYNN